MAKLGEQLQKEQQDQQQSRLTRTDKLKIKQEKERQEKERLRFEALKKEAQRIQEEKFKDKVVDVEEQYALYRPNRYTAKTWARMSQRQKDQALKPYLSNIQYHLAKKNIVVDSTQTRIVQKTIPFTLEDTGDQDNSYKDVYESLSPDLKQFFFTPEEVLQQKAERISTTKQTVYEKQAYADQKIQEARDKYAQQEARYEEKREQYRNAGYSSEKYREKVDRLKENLRDDEDKLDETIAKWQGYKQGLGKGLGELDANKDIDINSIEQYAMDVADYEERKEEARNENRNAYREKLYAGELNETLKAIGFKETDKPSLSAYSKAIDKYNKDVKYKNTLISWAKKVGFENISPQAQKILNPTAIEWQEKNPTEKLQFDKSGNVIGIASGKLQQSIRIEDYDQAVKEFKPVQSKVDFQDYDVPDAPYGSWTYNAKMGLYQAPSEPSGQATAVFRPPTPSEKIKIDTAQEKGDWYGKLITGLPAQYLQTLGGLTSKQIGTKDLQESGLMNNKWEVRVGDKTLADFGFLNPVAHYKIFKSNYDLKQEIKEITPYIEKYDKAYEEYEKVKVTQEQVDQGLVTEAEIERSNKAGATVNAIVDALEGEESYQSYKNRGEIITIDEKIAKGYETDPSKKNWIDAYFVGTGATRVIPYIIPATRIVMGVDMTAQGVDNLYEANTDLERAIALGETGLGVVVTYSGVKGVMPDVSGKVVGGTAKGLATRKILTHTAIVGLSTGVGVLDYSQTKKRTGSTRAGIFSGIGTTGALLTGTYLQTIVNKYNDWERTRHLTEIKQPKFSEKPFIKKEGDQLREVFYKRYTGFELKDTKTWKAWFKGQQKGTFLYREYALADPRVIASSQGKSEVSAYFLQKDGTYKWQTQKATPFPYESPSLHKGYFDQSNKVVQYYLPKNQLRDVLKNYQSFGFSATGTEWKATEFADDVLSNPRIYGRWNFPKDKLPSEINLGGAYQFTSGKGVSIKFLGIDGEYSLAQVGGITTESPTLYANYFKGSQVNPAQVEIKAFSKALQEDIKYYILRNKAQAGKIQLPVSKQEVEGVYEFIKRIPIRTNYFTRFGGRKVLIQDQVFAQNTGSTTNTDNLVKEILKKVGGNIADVSSVPSYSSAGMSYIPKMPNTSAYVSSARSSSNVSSIKSILRASQVSYTPTSSKAVSSAISNLLGSSTPVSSGLPKSSTPRLPSSSLKLSSISLPSSVYNPSSVSTPSKPSSTRAGALYFWLKGKQSIPKFKVRNVDYDKLYLPDFTSRSIGLDVEKITEKQALAKINKIQTGLELRRPIKVKW